MRIIRGTTWHAVWEHWFSVEGLPRDDICDELPDDLSWSEAVIELRDLDLIYISSSGDWTSVSNGTLLAREVVANLDDPPGDEHSRRIASDINSKVAFLHAGRTFENTLVPLTSAAPTR